MSLAPGSSRRGLPSGPARGLGVTGLALLAALPLLSGCLILPAFTSARVGALLPEDRLRALRAGTTQLELFDGFGPPTAVVRRGAGEVRVPGFHLRNIGSEELSGAGCFQRFQAQAPGPDDVVYYYRAHQLTTVGSGVAVILLNKGDLAGSSRDEHREDRLWVLLDGASGLVRSHVLERDVPLAPVEPPVPEGARATWGPGVDP